MGFDSFVNIAGIDHYYGMSEYGNGNDFDGLWGIWDDKFLNYYADQLAGFPKPFASVFFSVSSHHPFRVPEELEGKFKGGDQPILRCVEYTDYSLRQFFKKVSAQPWYDNTLFVITADHVSSNRVFPESHTVWGSFSIPIIFFKPDQSLAEYRHDLAQQIDILPTIMGLLHYDKPYVAFGRNLLDSTTQAFAFNFSETYNLLQGDYLLRFDGQRVNAFYDFKQDPMLRNNLVSSSHKQIASMEQTTKAIIQQYNNRMIEDRLTIKPE
jgi:phosphoglycerol transferase MdoB-like AlkP superfamily enzyme